MSTWNNLAGIEGDYVSDVLTLSPEGYVRISTFVVDASTPTTGDLIYYVRYSNDGSTWSGWEEQSNNENIESFIGEYIKKIQYKVLFERTDLTESPIVNSVAITINNKYLHLENDASLTFDTGMDVPEEFTQIHYMKLPASFTGIFLKYDDSFKIGYNGTRFYYEKGYRIVGGIPRSLSDGLFKVAVKSSKVIIYTNDYTETLV